MENAPSRRKMAGMPFIMPDGRPLSVFLTESNLMERRPRRSQKKRPGRIKEPAQGWTSSTRGSTHTSQRAPPKELTDAEHAELAALERVGQRRQRRWLNDKILRDMAPALTAKDMESLFKPAPFGETGYVSPFTMAAAREHAPLWDLFRSVDSDKQNRVLQKWEAHVQELRASASNDHKSAQSSKVLAAATAALKGWAAVGPRARTALRRAPKGCVEELEAPLLTLLDSETETEVVMQLDEGFQRLLTHGLAEFHCLLSVSRNRADGKREVAIRKRRRTATPADATAEAAEEKGSGASDAVHDVMSRITCVDVLWLLDDDEHGGLNVRALHEAISNPKHDHGSMMDLEHAHNASAPVVVAS